MLEREEFFDEMKEYITDLIQGEYKGVTAEEVIKPLYEKVNGNPDEAHDEIIYEVIEQLGGEPYDPSVEEDDYEEEEDEGDY